MGITFQSEAAVYSSRQRHGMVGMRHDMTPVEAALHLCESSTRSVADAKIAVAAIRQTVDRVHQTRRRTEELRGQRDSGTAGQRDSGTAGQRDSGTAGQRDSGRLTPHPECNEGSTLMFPGSRSSC
jgi:hypothetical protein